MYVYVNVCFLFLQLFFMPLPQLFLLFLSFNKAILRSSHILSIRLNYGLATETLFKNEEHPPT